MINVENKKLEVFSRRKSIEQADFQGKLQKAVQGMGSNLRTSSKSKKLTKPWIKARTFTAATDKEADFKEIKRGDATGIEEYDCQIK